MAKKKRKLKTRVIPSRRVTKSTGWMRARRVKIIRRRGQPAQVLIERPRKRARK